MTKFTASSAVDHHKFTGSENDFLYFQFKEYANPADYFDGGAGRDVIQIRSSMVARFDGKGPMIPTDENYDYTGIEFRSFEVLSFYPMAGMDMPGTVNFTSDQFGTDAKGHALISNRLELTGSNYSPTDVQKVIIDLAAGNSRFSAAHWTFTDSTIGALPVCWTEGQDIIRLIGSAGDNRITGSSQSDSINGRGGVDTVDYSAMSHSIRITLDGAKPSTVSIKGGSPDTLLNIENITAGSGNDYLSGDGHANRLNGGAGKDTLDGGGGADQFVFDGRHFGRDVIDHFAAVGARHDTLVFDRAVFSSASKALAAAHQVGQDVVISTGDPSDHVTLLDCKLTSLGLHDFLLS